LTRAALEELQDRARDGRIQYRAIHLKTRPSAVSLRPAMRVSVAALRRVSIFDCLQRFQEEWKGRIEKYGNAGICIRLESMSPALQGPLLAFVLQLHAASPAKGPLLSAQRLNLFSTWFGSASAARPTCVSTPAHNVVRMTCITQTTHARRAALGMVMWIGHGLWQSCGCGGPTTFTLTGFEMARVRLHGPQLLHDLSAVTGDRIHLPLHHCICRRWLRNS
jgi:hypothetical protein